MPSVCTLSGSCADALTTTTALMQHFQFQEKTHVKNSVRVVHYLCNDSEWLFVSLLLHRMLDVLPPALTSLRDQRKPELSYPEHHQLYLSARLKPSAWDRAVKNEGNWLGVLFKKEPDEWEQKGT